MCEGIRACKRSTRGSFLHARLPSDIIRTKNIEHEENSKFSISLRNFFSFFFLLSNLFLGNFLKIQWKNLRPWPLSRDFPWSCSANVGALLFTSGANKLELFHIYVCTILKSWVTSTKFHLSRLWVLNYPTSVHSSLEK